MFDNAVIHNNNPHLNYKAPNSYIERKVEKNTGINLKKVVVSLTAENARLNVENDKLKKTVEDLEKRLNIVEKKLFNLIAEKDFSERENKEIEEIKKVLYANSAEISLLLIIVMLYFYISKV